MISHHILKRARIKDSRYGIPLLEYFELLPPSKYPRLIKKSKKKIQECKAYSHFPSESDDARRFVSRHGSNSTTRACTKAWERIRYATRACTQDLATDQMCPRMQSRSQLPDSFKVALSPVVSNEEEINTPLSLLIHPWSLSHQQMGLG